MPAASKLIVADVLARLLRGTPMQAWLWEVDAVHRVWLDGLPVPDHMRIRATLEARIAGANAA